MTIFKPSQSTVFKDSHLKYLLKKQALYDHHHQPFSDRPE